MNIDRIKQLADTVEKGVVEFPQFGHTVALDLSAYWSISGVGILPERIDIPETAKVTACGCFVGFTILLFSPLANELVTRYDDGNGIPNIKTFDPSSEAKNILELSMQEAMLLFYGRMSSKITGPDAARVLRKFLMTEYVDWSIVQTY